MSQTDIIIVASFVGIILLLWVVVGSAQLKSRWKKMKGQWEILDAKLRKRQSLVPLLIESFRKYENNDALVAALMEERLNGCQAL